MTCDVVTFRWLHEKQRQVFTKLVRTPGDKTAFFQDIFLSFGLVTKRMLRHLTAMNEFPR